MANDDIAVRDLGLAPIAALAPGTKERALDDPSPAGLEPATEPVDALDRPPPHRALEDDADVVLPGRVRLEVPPARGPRPLAIHVSVERVVHQIDEPRSAGAAGD